jgi:hypothetical protein
MIIRLLNAREESRDKMRLQVLFVLLVLLALLCVIFGDWLITSLWNQLMASVADQLQFQKDKFCSTTNRGIVIRFTRGKLLFNSFHYSQLMCS